MYNILFVFVVCGSIYLLLVSAEMLLSRIEMRMDMKSDIRRENGRKKAYREVYERRMISDNRRDLWRFIRK